MKIGVPTEIKPQENRVALTPAGTDRLVSEGHQVVVQDGAGVASGFANDDYERAGGRILPDADAVWGEADMVMKVKEPLAEEWPRMRAGQTLFTYLHLAASEELTKAVRDTGSTCFAYETLVVPGEGLPLLTPMSEVAGRMSIQVGAHFLERYHGGSGVLLGGVPGCKAGKVLVLGGGIVGINAATMACGMGADVTIMDTNLGRLRYLSEVMPKNCRAIYSTPFTVREHLERADLVVGAVLVPGAAAPKLVRREDLAIMRPGSVIVDVAVDQGGCTETCVPTTHAEPVKEIEGILHYGVTNMPGAVPRTSTVALTNATLSWASTLARLGAKKALETSEPLRTAANVVGGHVTHPAVADAFGMPCVAPLEAAAQPA